MRRALFVVLMISGLARVSAVRADVEVAPPPREIRGDGTRDPSPIPGVGKQENPQEIVERIVQNSNAVGDKLAKTDAGTDTRKIQDTILKDIDALINREEDPNPNPDQNKDQDKDKKPDEKDKKEDMMPKDGMGGSKDPKDGGMGMGQPMGPKPTGKESKDPGMAGGTEMPPKKEGTGGKPKDDPAGKSPDPKSDSKNPPIRPSLPFEDEVVKDVWGHLPDKLRQQATQYYRQEFAPKYAELLRLYYESLAERKK